MKCDISGLMILDDGSFFFIETFDSSFISNSFKPVTGNLIYYNKNNILIYLGMCVRKHSSIYMEVL